MLELPSLNVQRVLLPPPMAAFSRSILKMRSFERYASARSQGEFILTVIQFAVHTLDYSFTNTEPREKDSFGLDVGGRMMLLPANKLPQLIEALNEEFPPPS